ncbi:uncharacterized protein LOC128720488 [Anopheles nili]|uniref:uncharacterized protein LOC128720488 n=1 Tax=Anopheles nili TaxID=185578 RepID=UPI00237ACC5A|nr:uncharacterized protein LOC128720488 [Anopheles nili]
MSTSPLSKEERVFRNQLWCERIQQQQYVRERPTTDEGDRPSSGPGSRLRQRSRGRGFRNHRHFGPELGDGTGQDNDIDDTLSEFAAGWYPTSRTGNRASVIRPSTLKKLNALLDAYQEERTGLAKGQSMLDLTRVGVDASSDDERPMRLPRVCLVEEETPQPEVRNSDEDPVEKLQPSAPPSTPVKALIPAHRSSAMGIQLVEQLITVSLFLSEKTLKQTLNVLKFMRRHLKQVLQFLWERFLQPCFAPGTIHGGVREMLTLVVVVPVVTLLATIYGIVCVLYWMNRCFLIETNHS